MRKKKRLQDDRYLKQLRRSERKHQEALRDQIKQTLDYLYATSS